jgi:uncharacterized SAM-binding protein YcdF (DUF218 family)
MRKRALLVGLTLTTVIAAAWHVDRVGVVVAPLDWSAPTAIVVLGARVDEGGVASPTLRARVTHAVEVARTGQPALFIVSGGIGNHGPSEAEVGLELARRLGLEATPTVREADSHSTQQNAECTARLLRARGLQRVVLVSDPSHLLRARLEFEGQGLQVQTSPALGGPRHRAWHLRAWWTLREVLALARFATRW